MSAVRINRACLVITAALLCAGCAGLPSPDGPDSRADLSVVIQDLQTGSLSYGIRCSGGEASVRGTTRVEAAAACRALARPAVQNRLIRGPEPEQVCTQVYGGPQTALISGTLAGQTVNAVVARDDGCGIGDWDNLLEDVLPPVARGAR